MPKPKKTRGRDSKNSAQTTALILSKAARSKKSSAARIVEFARVDEDPRAQAGYNALIGVTGTTGDLTLGNATQMQEISRQVLKTLSRHLVENAREWGIQTVPMGVLPGSNIEIDIPNYRKALRFYAKAGVDTIMMSTASPVPLPADPSGFGLSVVARALVFGADARTTLELASFKASQRRVNGPSRSAVAWFAPDDTAALKSALRAMFRPPLINGATIADTNDELTPEYWATGGSRGLRGLVTLMASSMVPVKKALAVVGDGKVIVAGALAAAEARMKKARRAGEPPVHPDGLPHFWCRELRRLGLADVEVPLIKLR